MKSTRHGSLRSPTSTTRTPEITNRPDRVGPALSGFDPRSRSNLDGSLKPSESATLTRVELLDHGATIELLRASYAAHRFAAHAHEEYAVGVVESGGIRTRVRRGTLLIPAGRIVVLNPGDVHTGEPADRAGYRYRMFYVGEALLRSLVGRDAGCEPASASGPTFRVPVLDDPPLASRLVRAHAMLESDGDRYAAEGALAEAIGELVLRYATLRRPATEHRTASRIVRLVREFLEDEHARVVSLAELSALTGRSPFSVSRIFREAIGLPPYAYLALVRLRRARELIVSGYPLSFVTHATGFSDQSHLTKQFKRVFGVPPGQYAREAARANRLDPTLRLRLTAATSAGAPRPGPSLPSLVQRRASA
jgi:AraC-like DNA-binding protein